MSRALISLSSFGAFSRRPLEILEEAGVECVFRPRGRRPSEGEMRGLVGEARYIIAGVEPITAKVMERAPNLRLISRVGVGLDSVDLPAARERGIQVAYTPEAPSAAVADLTIGVIASMLRGIRKADAALRAGRWERDIGRGIGDVTVGIVGVNRIGKRVARLLGAFGANLLGRDVRPDPEFGAELGIAWVEKEEIFRRADVITLHLPRTPGTANYVGEAELSLMKPDAVLVNTARGGLVDEKALAEALEGGRIGGAALDVFEEEPYAGPLASLDNVLLTSHIGSYTKESRVRMESEAAESVARFHRGLPVSRLAPEAEYELQGNRARGPSGGSGAT